MSIQSVDRAFSWSFSCGSTARPGSFVFTTFFSYPRGTTFGRSTVAMTIDDSIIPLEVDGADEGVSLTDASIDNTLTLSPRTRQMLAEGTTLRMPVRARSGATIEAVFNIAGGQGAFGEFERRCRALRH